MKTITSFILCAALSLILFSACSTPEQPMRHTAAELLDLGEKYLLELNYEQALVQFLAVIEIEPMNPRGYTGAAEAYLGLGREEEAVAILLQGVLVLPGNEEIQSLLDELRSPNSMSNTPALEPEPSPELESETEPESESDNVEDNATIESLRKDELTVNGIRLGEGSINDFAASFGLEIFESWTGHYDGRTVMGNVILEGGRGEPATWLNQAHGSSYVGYLQVFRTGVVGPRGIVIGVTTMKEALEILNDGPESLALSNDEPPREYVGYSFDDGYGGEALFRIFFENDIVGYVIYDEDNFWSYAN